MSKCEPSSGVCKWSINVPRLNCEDWKCGDTSTSDVFAFSTPIAVEKIQRFCIQSVYTTEQRLKLRIQLVDNQLGAFLELQCAAWLETEDNERLGGAAQCELAHARARV